MYIYLKFKNNESNKKKPFKLEKIIIASSLVLKCERAEKVIQSRSKAQNKLPPNRNVWLCPCLQLLYSSATLQINIECTLLYIYIFK